MALLKFLVKDDESDIKQLLTHIKDQQIVDILIRQGVKSLRPIQIEAIQKHLFLGRNILICTPSGSRTYFHSNNCYTCNRVFYII